MLYSNACRSSLPTEDGRGAVEPLRPLTRCCQPLERCAVCLAAAGGRGRGRWPGASGCQAARRHVAGAAVIAACAFGPCSNQCSSPTCVQAPAASASGSVCLEQQTRWQPRCFLVLQCLCLCKTSGRLVSQAPAPSLTVLPRTAIPQEEDLVTALSGATSQSASRRPESTSSGALSRADSRPRKPCGLRTCVLPRPRAEPTNALRAKH